MNRTTFFSIGLPLALLGCLGLVAVSGCVEPDSTGAKSEVTVQVRAADSVGEEVVDVTPGDGPAGDPGSLVGKVSLKGSFAGLPPVIAKGTSAKDPEFCGKESDIPNETLIVSNGGVANVVIYMDKVPKKLTKLPPPTEHVVFDQKNCQFLPHVLLVRTGQPIHIWNSDGAAHNTHTYPKKNTGFSSTVKPLDQSEGTQIVYKKAESEPLAVGCDFHAWMKAYHFPVDHPFAAVTGPDGSFEIKDIPPGKYRFKVWHEGKYLARRIDVEVKPGAPTTLDLPYTVAELTK